MNIIYGNLDIFEEENPQVCQKIRADEKAKILSKGKEFMADKNEKCKCVDCFFRWIYKKGSL